MRNVFPIRYEWVKFLLPKLRQVEVRALSTTGKISAVALASVGGVGREKGVARHQPLPSSPSDIDSKKRAEEREAAAAEAAKRRNTSADVEAARERALARKWVLGREGGVEIRDSSHDLSPCPQTRQDGEEVRFFSNRSSAPPTKYSD